MICWFIRCYPHCLQVSKTFLLWGERQRAMWPFNAAATVPWRKYKNILYTRGPEIFVHREDLLVSSQSHSCDNWYSHIFSHHISKANLCSMPTAQKQQNPRHPSCSNLFATSGFVCHQCPSNSLFVGCQASPVVQTIAWRYYAELEWKSRRKTSNFERLWDNYVNNVNFHLVKDLANRKNRKLMENPCGSGTLVLGK